MPPGTSPRAPNGRKPTGLLALLDIGSTKIACAITETSGARRTLACLTVPSTGIRSGDIHQSQAAHGAISKAIVEAERMAGAAAAGAVVAVAAGCPLALHLTADLSLDPTIVTASRIDVLKARLLQHAERDQRIAVHIEQGDYRLDGRTTATAPIDRFGRCLEMDVTAVTVDQAPLRRLLAAVEATNLQCLGVIPAGLAAGLAVTTSAERAAGIAVVDIGGDHTTVTAFKAGRLMATTTLALGMQAVVADVAAALQVSHSKAERIIATYGIDSLAHAEPHDADMRPDNSGRSNIAPPTAARAVDARAGAPSSEIGSPRLDMLLRLVADRLDQLHVGLPVSSRVVLTGGGSRLPGLPASAAHLWGRLVRAGQPQLDGGAIPADPSASVLAGLVLGTQSVACGVRFREAGQRQVA